MALKITNKILMHFKNVDPKIHSILLHLDVEPRIQNTDHFFALVRTIVFQQVSGAAGTAIFKRLQELVPIEPKAILSKSDDELRNVGLSYRKASYIKSIAEHILNGSVYFDTIDTMSNQEIIEMLVQIKGVGIWTAQMYMMFALHREDVDSYGDLAIKKGYQNLYSLSELPTEEEYMRSVKKWTPYNTYACLALWEASIKQKD